jgi:hypothetical protein
MELDQLRQEFAAAKNESAEWQTKFYHLHYERTTQMKATDAIMANLTMASQPTAPNAVRSATPTLSFPLYRRSLPTFFNNAPICNKF